MVRFALAGLSMALLAVAVAAQPPPLVTEAEILSALERTHPALADGEEALARARARVMAASALEDPILAMAREDPAGPAAQTDWSLSWQVPGARRRFAIAAQEKGVEAASAHLVQQRLALRLAVRETFARWALAAARRDRLSAQAQRLDALARREAVRAQRGEASGLEVHRLDLALAGIRVRVALAAASEESAKAAVAAWWPALPLDARPVLPEPGPAPQLGASHPLIAAAEADLAAAGWERKAASRFVPSPELSVGWQRQEAGALGVEGPLVGFAWSLPVFGGRRAEKALAEARLAGAQGRLARVRWEIDAGRRSVLASFRQLERALEETRQILSGNQWALDGAEAAFRLGESSLTDLLETRRSVTESELTELDLLEAALATHRELERLAGASPSTGRENDP